MPTSTYSAVVDFVLVVLIGFLQRPCVAWHVHSTYIYVDNRWHMFDMEELRVAFRCPKNKFFPSGTAFPGFHIYDTWVSRRVLLYPAIRIGQCPLANSIHWGIVCGKKRRFPEMGVPQIIHVLMVFPSINHPFWGYPHDELETHSITHQPSKKPYK